ncbi:hypothetical protein [Streptomyces albiflavescens]|uniref:hypothetical protein n=1 Tax=Streptomyces albiflavescens TaxID=1623582 RepID=UPI001E2839E0|nr:hypothetical protein [Streptomyces albiflavescens]
MAAVLGVSAGALLLSGCGAVDLPLAAVRMGTDGAPRALIRPCGDDTYRGAALDGRPRSGGKGPATGGWDTKGEHGGDAAFPLFTPPADWKARHRGTQRLLPDHRYTLSFHHYVTGDSYNGVVEFTAEDITALKPGQVWADGRAMSPGEFEKLAEDSC